MRSNLDSRQIRSTLLQFVAMARTLKPGRAERHPSRMKRKKETTKIPHRHSRRSEKSRNSRRHHNDRKRQRSTSDSTEIPHRHSRHSEKSRNSRRRHSDRKRQRSTSDRDIRDRGSPVQADESQTPPWLEGKQSLKEMLREDFDQACSVRCKLFEDWTEYEEHLPVRELGSCVRSPTWLVAVKLKSWREAFASCATTLNLGGLLATWRARPTRANPLPFFQPSL